MKPILGTCYYPEHWPEQQWQDDAQRMAALGLRLVRIGEFAWSRLEPTQGNYQWGWLDRAIEVLGNAGLQVVLGTPSATPPRWMTDLYLDMLAVDESGDVRKFGSRRHYCFSHKKYRQAATKMAALMAKRYASSPYLHSWQLDNEYGCHDTTVSYSESAREQFQHWLKGKYGDIKNLNSAWGNVFWSMEYQQFAQIELPNLTVTEPNPSHVLDFRRFSSDCIVQFNKAQADAIRQYSDKPLIHNYMGRITDFDHYKVGDDLDIASWDSYPLGFLVDRSGASKEWQHKFERQGEPDFQALHHDLYREVGRGRWWVMEQQPGPVNWAPYNPAPLAGMVRLWTLEAIAHQAEAVCYFRWRQAPFAQEQMHSGLLRPDSEASAAFTEVENLAQELAVLGSIEPQQAQVALLFDYESCWAWEAQPQGHDFGAFSLVYEFYKSLRSLGLSVDIVRPDRESFEGYKLILVPGLFSLSASLQEKLAASTGLVMYGPRTGSRDNNFHIPVPLPPAIDGLDCLISQVETLAPDTIRPLTGGGHIKCWLEYLETSSEVVESLVTGEPVLVAGDTCFYLGAWPDQQALSRILQVLATKAGIQVEHMPEGVRKRVTQNYEFIFNYNAEAVEFRGEKIAPAGVQINSI